MLGAERGGHPPHEGWQEARLALSEALGIAGLPVISSEAGIKVADAGGLEHVTPAELRRFTTCSSFGAP